MHIATLTKGELTSYFRRADKTSDVIGGRQAGVFQVFRSLAGHEQPNRDLTGKAPPKVKQSRAKSAGQTKAKPSTETPDTKIETPIKGGRKDISLTVRIEVNLPANGSKEIYDNIFKSIRANFIDE